jgi:hypothetical protein
MNRGDYQFIRAGLLLTTSRKRAQAAPKIFLPSAAPAGIGEKRAEVAMCNAEKV